MTKRERAFWLACGLLLLNGAYLFARTDANVFYIANVLLHLVLGVGIVVVAARPIVRALAARDPVVRLSAAFLALGSAVGLAIAVLGGTRPFRPIVTGHVVLIVAGVALLPFALRRRSGRWSGLPQWVGVFILVTVGAALVVRAIPAPPGRSVVNSGAPYGSYRIENPPLPPETMAGEMRDGDQSPFFPASVETSDGNFIPSDFFLGSERCGQTGCHPDIYEQWSESMHRFSSFNNQWYRRALTYMQETQGQIESSKWCAGCHDPAVLIPGLWTKPMAEQLNIPEANAGLGCTACHSISHVKNTMGNSGFVYEYPTMHRFAASDNALMKALHDYIVKLEPAPHRDTFLKPFMREQPAEFCSTCHKVHLDKPVNDFRWIRGFDEYDAWQASGVSGQGALSFYYPPKPLACRDCHMPLVPSDDKGNIDGKVHSHRFPAANTALPYAWQRKGQMAATTTFLKSNVVTLDIFGMTIGEAKQAAAASYAIGGPQAATLSGDETALLHGAVGGMATDVNRLIAPLGEVDASIRRGDSARISVVVRTRGVGHRFPGGTFDAFDVWVELEVRDETGRIIMHSGGLEPNGSVDRGAHFYRAAMLDAHGNIIDKRNAWAARTVLYARGIPPGAADTVHFRLNVPDDSGDRLFLRARLKYRKFSQFYTGFSYAGVPADDAPFAPDYDDRTWTFTGDTSDVAGVIKRIPNLPIVTLAEDAAEIRVLDGDAPEPPIRTVETQTVRERWNDYGIGLLLQGDLKGARNVFERVTRMDPEYPDGWVNVARAALREGDLDVAESNLREAIRRLDATPPENPHRAKAHYFLAQVYSRRGELDRAEAELRIAARQYPRDRNVLNGLGRVYFLLRKFPAAIEQFEKTLRIDPEDLTAHYNLMLSYQGIGDRERARQHQRLYVRFKADESSQAITGDVRRRYPELNLERQAIREHYDMTTASRSSSPRETLSGQKTAQIDDRESDDE